MQMKILHGLSLFVGLGFALPESYLQARGQSSSTSSQSFQAECEAFASKINGNKNAFQNDVTLHSITYIPSGANVSMATTPASCASDALSSASPVEFCRVSLNVTTSSKSQIYMEAWFPGNYTGRFLSTGNGGLGGCKYPSPSCT